MASCLRIVSSNSSKQVSAFGSLKLKWGTRSVHRIKQLPYPVEGGLGKFLPPDALRTLVEYQEGLLERLNNELRTDPKAELNANVSQIAIRYSTQRERTLAFNYAVLALNNSFFLDQLAPPPEDPEIETHQNKISPELSSKIIEHYGGLQQLKSSFSAAALGMFSNGWVWMVTDNKGNLGAIPTFGPSTLLVRSRSNMHYDTGIVLGEEDTVKKSNIPPPLPSMPSSGSSTTSSPASGVPLGTPTSKPYDPHVRFIHASRPSPYSFQYNQPSSLYDSNPRSPAPSKAETAHPVLHVGGKLFPLFCVPVYEHAWMSAGYGVWGKEPWLKEFWNVLDWGKVSRAYQIHQDSLHSY